MLDGAVLAAAAVGADEAIVCVKRDASAAVSAATLAIGERGSSDGVEVSVVEVPAAYVAGEESALVNFLNTGRAIPTFVPPRPFERGVDGRPTLIQNVETLAHLALIARHGADWFRGVGDSGRSRDRPWSRSAGRLPRQAFTRCRAVCPCGSFVEHAGGPTTPIRAFLVGGYAGSWSLGERALDQPLDRARRRTRRGGSAPGCWWPFRRPPAACARRRA